MFGNRFFGGGKPERNQANSEENKELGYKIIGRALSVVSSVKEGVQKGGRSVDRIEIADLIPDGFESKLTVERVLEAMGVSKRDREKSVVEVKAIADLMKFIWNTKVEDLQFVQLRRVEDNQLGSQYFELKPKVVDALEKDYRAKLQGAVKSSSEAEEIKVPWGDHPVWKEIKKEVDKPVVGKEAEELGINKADAERIMKHIQEQIDEPDKEGE